MPGAGNRCAGNIMTGNAAAILRLWVCRHRFPALFAGIAIFLSFANSCVGAALPVPPGSSLRFRHISIRDGLAQSSVQAIAQDQQGYMWFATQDGLQRYDGYDFVTYRHDPANPASLADNDINALCADRGGTLWIATSEVGLDRLDPGSDSFIHYQHRKSDPDSLISDTVWTVMRDQQGHVWVGTDSGLDRLDVQTGRFRHYPIRSTRPNATNVWTLFQDRQGRLWVGATRRLYYYDAGQDALRPFMPKLPASPLAKLLLTGTTVNAMTQSRDGMLWLATEKGLVEMTPAGAVRAVYQHHASDPFSLPNGRVRAILEDGAGDIWVGTAQGGVSRLERATGRFINYEHDATDPGSLSGNQIASLYRDRAGLIWIGTQLTGLDIFNPATREFGYYRHRQGEANSLASNDVWGIYKDARGDVWVATDGGVTRMDPTRTRYTQYAFGERPQNSLDDATADYILGDSRGVVWAGADYGLYEFIPAEQRFQRFSLLANKRANPVGNTVNVIFEDSRKRFWVGTGEGLVLFDRKTGRVAQRFINNPQRADSLPNNSVYALCEDRNGGLWVGTGNGLGYFDGVHDRFRVFAPNRASLHSLSSRVVQACLVTADGTLWLGTASGLDALPPGADQFIVYTTVDGLPNNNIYALLSDRAGHLWLSSDKGLSEFDPLTHKFRNYDESDGLQSDEFNAGAAYQSADGELFFGGINGLTAFYPDRLQRNTTPPRVVLTQFTELGKPLAVAASGGEVPHLTLPYRDNILTFAFAALDYAAPDRNRFQYRLQGFDAAWHSTDRRHLATYTNLDPGDYLFSVKGSNNDGVWGTDAAELRLTILPPPWRSGWAYVLYAVVALLLLLTGLRLYRNSLARRHALATEQQKRQWAETLHHLIQSVSGLRAARPIGEQLVDSLAHFIGDARAWFYVEQDGALQLVAAHGVRENARQSLAQWPVKQPGAIARLRGARDPLLLSVQETAALHADPADTRRHICLAVPAAGRDGEFRLLLVEREGEEFEPQTVNLCAAMTKQVGVALDNARLIRELENLATTDGLTRLANRRYFMERAESEFVRNRRYHRDLSLLLLDADNFKAVNDTHGHESGDRVLRALAGVCRENLRQLDMAARYGGEEFIVLLPETSAETALQVAERLRQAVEKLVVPLEGVSGHITISIGVATASAATASLAALISDADRALYQAKRLGRNRVVAAA